MKKVFITTIYIYLIFRLISSCAVRDVYNDSLNQVLLDSTIMNISVKIEPIDLDIMPPSLGVQFYRNGIVFLADSKNEENISTGHVSFGTLQAYYAPFKDTLGQHTIFSPNPAFQYPCDALSFTNDFGTMYYTRTVGKKAREKIFRAENFIIDENRQLWTYYPEPLAFCKEESRYSHPAISADGNFMIFASDMEGSVGGMDLFITRNKNMIWSEPENLGKLINSRENELFPLLDRNNNLFFSSNGRKGAGGYDIFICRFNGNNWDMPVRLTNSINTKNNEFAFTIDKLTGNSAFFTSMGTNRDAVLQLYRISLKNNSSPAENTDLTALLWSMSSSNIDSLEIKLMLKQLEAEKMRADSIEKARSEAEKTKKAKAIADSIAGVNLRAERLKAERLSADKLKTDSITAAKLEAERLIEERLKAEKIKADSIEAAKLIAQQSEAERIKAANKRKSDSLAAERMKTERMKTERLRTEKLKADSIAAAKLTAQRLENERLRAAKIKSDSIQAARLIAEKLEVDRLRIEKNRTDSIEAARLAILKRESKDVIVFRVQILSSLKPRGNFDVTIDGVKYTASQYFYMDAYRYVLGEFSNIDAARDIQYKARASGWPQAFVAAFKNGTRTLDISLFK